MEHLDRNVTQVGLPELAVFHSGVCFQSVRGAAAFVHTHVELAAGKCSLHPAEEDRYLVWLHDRGCRNQLIAVILGVKVEKMVLL